MARGGFKLILWQTSFLAGEVSQRAAARADLPFYAQAAQELKNLFVMPEGGVTRAPGTVFHGSVAAEGRPTRLLSFRRSSGESVVCVLNGGEIRLLEAADLKDVLGSDNAPVVLAHPWADEDLANIYAWQSADVMWITCKSGTYRPRVLIAFEDNSWGLEPFGTELGPFEPVNTDDDHTMTVVGSGDSVGAQITVRSSRSFFQPGHDGALLRLFEPFNGRPYEAWKAEEEDLTVGVLRIHDGRVYQVQSGSGRVASRQPPVHETGVVSDGATEPVQWAFVHDLAGAVRITQVIDGFSVNAVVEKTLTGNFPTTSWAIGSFSDENGWPLVGGIFQSRLCFAGSARFPDTMWMSRTNGFSPRSSDFEQTTGGGEVNDDHAVVRTLNDSAVRRVSAFMTEEQILLFHSGGVTRVTGPSINEPITPAGASAVRPPAPPGCNFLCNPVQAGARFIYASKGGRELISLDPIEFSFDTLTALRRDIGAESRFRKLVYAFEEVRRLFVLRDDGRLFCCTFDPEREMRAFTTLTFGGSFGAREPFVEDIEIAPDDDGRDRLFLVIRRTSGDGTRTTIERMAPDFEGERQRVTDAIFADSAGVLNGWNTDLNKTLRLVGGSPTQRDAIAEFEAVGWTPGSEDVGRWIKVRRPFDEEDLLTAVFEIVEVNGQSLRGRLDVDWPDAFANRALSDWGFAVHVLSGLGHLEGEEVGLYADGIDLGDVRVADGAVSLQGDVAVQVCAGYRKEWRATTLDILPAVQLPAQGLGKGAIKAVKKVFVEVEFAQAGTAEVFWSTDEKVGTSTPVQPRRVDDPGALHPLMRSGVAELGVSNSTGRTLTATLRGNQLGPFSLLGMGVET